MEDWERASLPLFFFFSSSIIRLRFTIWTPGTNRPLECLEYFHGWATNEKYLIQSVNDTLVWLDLKTIHIQFMNLKMAGRWII